MIEARETKAPSATRNGRQGRRQQDFEDLVRVGPGTPMGTYLRRFWHPVIVADEVQPGQARPARILGEDLTVYRGQAGAPHVVAARCAHRSTVLHVGWVEGDCIRCRYHGWKYDATGQCVEMPAEDPSFPPKVRIAGYPAREYAGLVFVYLGDGEPPPFARKAELERDYGVSWVFSYVWPCNWFQRIENSMDAVHVSFVHRDTPMGQAISVTLPRLEYEETEWGILQRAIRSDDNVRLSEYHWPNLNHIVIPGPVSARDPWADLFNWFVPVDDRHTALFSAHSAPVTGEKARELEETLARCGVYNPADHHDAVFRGEGWPSSSEQLVAAEDYLIQVGQGQIVDRAEERLGQSDAGIIFLRRLFWRELEAMKRRRPGKQWQPRTGFARLPVPPGVPSPADPAD